MTRNKWLWTIVLALPLAFGGIVYAQSRTKASAPQKSAGYICPLTGEELPCPECCPLKRK